MTRYLGVRVILFSFRGLSAGIRVYFNFEVRKPAGNVATSGWPADVPGSRRLCHTPDGIEFVGFFFNLTQV